MSLLRADARPLTLSRKGRGNRQQHESRRDLSQGQRKARAEETTDARARYIYLAATTGALAEACANSLKTPRPMAVCAAISMRQA